MAPSRGSNSLIAVILVARSKPGPHIIFHYPPDPQVSGGLFGENSRDDDESGGELDLDLNLVNNGAYEFNSNGTSRAIGGQINRDRLYADPPKAIAASDSILGYREDTLQRLLAPGCWSDRTKFEISLDGLTFLGHPIYAAQDGSWAKKHTHSEERSTSRPGLRASTPTPKNRDEQDFAHAESSVGITITEPKTPAKEVRDFTHVPESFDSNQTGGRSVATSVQSGSSIAAVTAPEQLTMFNVVFVLRPSGSIQSSIDASNLYKHVAKKLSKALHYCQNQTQYLGIESKRLLAMKAKGRLEAGTDAKDLGERMVESSELAWALKEVYEKISNNGIAGIRLNGMPISLQIPLDDSTQSSNKIELNPHAGLLFLEDKDTLLRELAGPDASPLRYYVSEHTPTKSLQKQAANLGMGIEDVLTLARHLVKWRKARAISPLHQRNTYIVGRDAPLDKLQSFFIGDYERKFAGLPSLPQVLKVLSGKPLKYGLLIRSRDHRAPYMDVLAYLVQHRFVEQLKTYGWLQASDSLVSKAPSAGEEEMNRNKRPLDVLSLLSPQMRPVSDDDALSVSSERTTIPISVIESNKKALKNATSSPHTNDSADRIGGPAESEPALKIITNPRDLSAEVQRRLRHISESVKDAELAERLPSLLRHFDGESAFEEIAATEGLKRSKLDSWLDTLMEEGFLVSFRAL